jgi:hypothetical protein
VKRERYDDVKREIYDDVKGEVKGLVVSVMTRRITSSDDHCTIRYDTIQCSLVWRIVQCGVLERTDSPLT